MFKKLYRKMLVLSSKPKAERSLYGLTFFESIFFPIPTDIMLVPMCIASPEKSLRYAWMMSIYSILGGVIAYILGFFFFEQIRGSIDYFFAESQIQQVRDAFDELGYLMGFVAALTPLPFKLFALTAGFLKGNLLVFVVSSFAGRLVRYGLIAVTLFYFGSRIRPFILKYVNILGCLFLILVMVYMVWRWTH